VLVWEWRSQADDARLALVNGLGRIPFLVLTGAVLLLLARKAKLDFPRTVAAIFILVAWLDVLTHEPAQNPTVPPGVYQLNLAREQAAMNPQPELGGSRAMVSPKAYMEFIQMAVRDPKVNFLAKRAGYCADCNLLDAVPKVDGFFSLTTRENNNLFSLIYGATNDFPRLEDFMGVSQITAPDEIYKWQARKTFLPLVTAGQKPIFLDDANTLQALASDEFDGSKMVFLPPEEKSLVAVTNGTMAQVLNSKMQNARVEIEVTSPAPSLVVVAQTFYHNWQASVDGQQVPLLHANYGFQAIQVGQGRHEVELVYRDSAFKIGALFSIVGWLGCLAGLFICRTGRANLR